jgi:hypothetical protein
MAVNATNPIRRTSSLKKGRWIGLDPILEGHATCFLVDLQLIVGAVDVYRLFWSPNSAFYMGIIAHLGRRAGRLRCPWGDEDRTWAGDMLRRPMKGLAEFEDQEDPGA